MIIQGSLKAKHTTIWTDGKCRGGKTQRRERVSRNKIKLCEGVEKSGITVFFFQCFVAPENRKVSSLKRRVDAEPSGEMRDQKMHAVVARSTFPSH